MHQTIIDQAANQQILDREKSIQQEKILSLEAVDQLFQEFQRQCIRYCHWKSNIRLDKSLQGGTDLDLLVDREQSQAFRRILTDHNIKPVLAAPGQRYPAMEHYLGLDETMGKLFHLHAHYQLVLGEQFVKNYRLPLDDIFLDSVQDRYGVKIPSPELELIVLSIRILLKYRARDFVKDVIPYRIPGLSPAFRQEVQWLLARTTRERVVRALERMPDVVDTDLVLKFLDIATSGKRAGLKLYLLRNRIRRTLNRYQRTNALSATMLYFRQMWDRRKGFRSSPLTGMTLPEGGLRLALIGIDGAGKSTLSEMLSKWLSWKLDVRICYLGSKPPSRTSRTLYTLFRVFRRSRNILAKGMGELNLLSRWLAGLRDIFLAWHFLSIGQDRLKRYIACEKQAMNGSVVIYDRFPLGAIAPDVNASLMDGPQIASLFDNNQKGLIRLMSRAEAQLYRQMRAPDYLFVLNVDPEVSVQRKPDHKRELVEMKSRVMNDLIAKIDSEKVSHVIQIDANAPLEMVSSQLKKEIWYCL